MNTITHALLPVLTCSLIGKRSLLTSGLKTKEYFLIALFGAAPDLLNPHFTLAARYASWSHSLWFWATLTAVLFAIFRTKQISGSMVVLLSTSYFTHLLCDALAGGLAWNYPFSARVIGNYYIVATWWIPLDAVCILIAYFKFRLPILKRKNSHS